MSPIPLVPWGEGGAHLLGGDGMGGGGVPSSDEETDAVVCTLAICVQYVLCGPESLLREADYFLDPRAKTFGLEIDGVPRRLFIPALQ